MALKAKTVARHESALAKITKRFETRRAAELKNLEKIRAAITRYEDALKELAITHKRASRDTLIWLGIRVNGTKIATDPDSVIDVMEDYDYEKLSPPSIGWGASESEIQERRAKKLTSKRPGRYESAAMARTALPPRS